MIKEHLKKNKKKLFPLNQKQQRIAFTTNPRPIPTMNQSPKQEEHGQREEAQTPKPQHVILL